MKKQRRTKFIVYPKFQYTLIIVNLMTLSLFTFATFNLIYFSFNKLISTGNEAGLNPSHPFFTFVENQRSEIFTTLGIGLTVFFILSSIVITYFSHKLAGPLVRLKEYLIAEKHNHKQSPLEFRKNDYFSELPEIINNALEKKVDSNNIDNTEDDSQDDSQDKKAS